MPDKHKGVAGMMAGFSLILGIFVGIIFSFPMSAVVENFGSSHYEKLVCDITDAALYNMSSVTPTGRDLLVTMSLP